MIPKVPLPRTGFLSSRAERTCRQLLPVLVLDRQGQQRARLQEPAEAFQGQAEAGPSKDSTPKAWATRHVER